MPEKFACAQISSNSNSKVQDQEEVLVIIIFKSLPSIECVAKGMPYGEQALAELFNPIMNNSKINNFSFSIVLAFI